MGGNGIEVLDTPAASGAADGERGGRRAETDGGRQIVAECQAGGDGRHEDITRAGLVDDGRRGYRRLPERHVGDPVAGDVYPPRRRR